MKLVYLILFTIFCFANLHTVEHWQNIRFSAQTADNEIAVRCEIPTDGEITLLYQTDAGISECLMEPVWVSDLSYQAFIPAAVNQTRALGFRSELTQTQPDSIYTHLLPVKLCEEQEANYDNLSWVIDDPVGDIPFTEIHLDIVANYISYDENKLYFGIQNQGGGFPVSDALWGPFYSYMALLTPPDVSYLPFGLLYTVDQDPFIQPGLYKLTGSGMDDLELIAEIEAEIYEADDLLVLSCEWDDLLAEDDFTAWFDIDEPRFNYLTTTAKITLSGGLQEADITDLAAIYPQPVSAYPEENVLPVLSGFSIEQGEYRYVSIDYDDENANFALTAEAEFDDGTILPLIPQSFDFSQIVNYRTNQSHPALEDDSWEWITIRVSDNNTDFVEYTQSNTSSQPVLIPEMTELHQSFPNPYKPDRDIKTEISFSIPISQKVSLQIYNLKGQLIKTLSDDYLSAGKHSIIWDGKSEAGTPVASGIYFYSLTTKNRVLNRKVIIIR